MNARAARWRDVDGILLLDKPAGMSSNAILQRVRRLFQARKAGHTGSLDPFATGLLPICFGQATKVCAFLLDADKTYQVICELGRRTTTGDPEGEEIEVQDVPDLNNEQLSKVLSGFIGPGQQIPPMYSALKHQGKRLYELARAGETVERPPRPITVHEIDLQHFDGRELGFQVRCSKGTYVRTLVEDIAAELGTVAHTTSLRRIAIHPFSSGNMVSLEQLQDIEDLAFGAGDEMLLPVETALTDYPVVNLDPVQTQALVQGRPVGPIDGGKSGLTRIYGPGGRFLGIGEVQADGVLKARRLMATSGL
jgi:tRNA pseudouridine55 synthase